MCKKTKPFLLALALLLSTSLWGQQSGSLPESMLGGQDPLIRVLALLNKLQLQNKTWQEQYEALMQLSQSSEEQLTALQSERQLDKGDLTLLKSISETQGEYLNRLQADLQKLREITQRQSGLLKKSLLKNKVLTISVCAGVPAAFIGGLVVGLMVSR
jgi:hypothetical protein